MTRIQTISLDVSLKESATEVRNKVGLEIVKILNKKLQQPQFLNKIRGAAQEFLTIGIESQPEYQSLIHGLLKYELGLLQGARRMDQIIALWIAGIQIDLTPFKFTGNNLQGGLTVKAVQSDYKDVISSIPAIQVTEKGEELYWLLWLLLDGNNTIIADYSIQYGPSAASRTGLAVMVRDGGSWGVPHGYTGTIKDNFVIRGIKSIEEPLGTRLKNLFKKQVNG